MKNKWTQTAAVEAEEREREAYDAEHGTNHSLSDAERQDCLLRSGGCVEWEEKFGKLLDALETSAQDAGEALAGGDLGLVNQILRHVKRDRGAIIDFLNGRSTSDEPGPQGP